MVEVRKLRPEVGFESTAFGLLVRRSGQINPCGVQGLTLLWPMTRLPQLGERRTSNPKVVGSNLTSGRSFRTSTIHSKSSRKSLLNYIEGWLTPNFSGLKTAAHRGTCQSMTDDQRQNQIGDNEKWINIELFINNKMQNKINTERNNWNYITLCPHSKRYKGQ